MNSCSASGRSPFLLGAVVGAAMAFMLTFQVRSGGCSGAGTAATATNSAPDHINAHLWAQSGNLCPPCPVRRPCTQLEDAVGTQPGVVPVASGAAAGAAAVAAAAASVPSLSSCTKSGGAQRVFDEFKHTSASKENHCYSWMYGDLLGRFHCKGSLQHNKAGGEQLRMLEIGFGVGEPTAGSSTELWRTVFPGAEIHIMEYADSPLLVPYSQAFNFKLHRGDQSNLTTLAAVAASAPGGFDIIIDDGGHKMRHQLMSMTGLWPHVRPGGVYIVEDVETAYYQNYGGGKPGKEGTFIASAKSMIDVLNLQFIQRRSLPEPTLRFPFDEEIASVKCYRNLCAFEKKYGNEFPQSGCKSGAPQEVPNPRPDFPAATRCAVEAW